MFEAVFVKTTVCVCVCVQGATCDSTQETVCDSHQTGFSHH